MFNRYEVYVMHKFVKNVNELIKKGELEQYSMQNIIEDTIAELKSLDLDIMEIKELIKDAVEELSINNEGFDEYLGFAVEELKKRDAKVSRELQALVYFHKIGDLTENDVIDGVGEIGHLSGLSANGKNYNKLIDEVNVMMDLCIDKKEVFDTLNEEYSEYFEEINNAEELVKTGLELITSAKRQKIVAARVIFYIKELFGIDTAIIFLKALNEILK